MAFTPGYYQSNPRAYRYRELVRLHGRRRAIKRWFTSRFARPHGGTWMPGLWTDTECRAEDLSEQFWKAARLHDTNFKRLGFVECGFLKITKILIPMFRDTGGIRYQDPTRRYFATLLYHRLRSPSTGADIHRMYIFFAAIYQKETLICTNHKQSVDTLSGDEIIRVKSCDVNSVHQEFLKHIKLRNETPRAFPDQESLRHWFDTRAIAVFEERMRRGLFIPMTDPQIAAAKVKMAEADAGIFPPLKSKLRLGLWPIIIILIIALDLARSHHIHHRFGNDNTIEYQGQGFKLSRAYGSYEDYKDDPNNLNTNELDRIEQAMTAAKAPSTFTDQGAVIRFMFDLKFPGYGAETLPVETDDGSKLEADSVEIPQRDKDRWFVVRQDRGQYDLVDDFVFATTTNRIDTIKLEKQVLHYYDSGGHLIRETHLTQP